MKLFKEIKTTQIKIMADNLREFRRSKGIGLRELSRKTGISPATISLIETYQCCTTKETANIIENALLKRI